MEQQKKENRFVLCCKSNTINKIYKMKTIHHRTYLINYNTIVVYNKCNLHV